MQKISLFPILLSLFLLPLSLLAQKTSTVNSLVALKEVLVKAQAGDTIFLEDGNYGDAPFMLAAMGTAAKSIIIQAKTRGKAIIQSPIELKADYVSLIGLTFSEKGYLEMLGRGCRLSKCVFSDVKNGKWVRVLPGSSQMEIDHNLFENKTINRELARGCQLMQIVVLNENERHHIHHNLFRDIPQGSGNGFETLQLITKDNPFDPPPGACNTIIENNLFERCNGEAEIISVKSNGNLLRNNTFRACRGGLVLRHGDDNIVTGNFFFGDGEAGSGGVRLQGTGQLVANNYFHQLGKYAIGMMDGTPDDLYIRVEGAQILFNTFIDCQKTFTIGLNHSKHPKGTTPKDCKILGNLFLNTTASTETFIEFVQNDEPENWLWKHNLAFGAPVLTGINGIRTEDPQLNRQESDWYLPTAKTPKGKGPRLQDPSVMEDLFGTAWKKKRTIGAIQFPLKSKPANIPLSENGVGPWAIN